MTTLFFQVLSFLSFLDLLLLSVLASLSRPTQGERRTMAGRKSVVAFIEECHIAGYVFDLRHVESQEGKKNVYRAVFSKPSKQEPIPRAVVYVTYTVNGTPDEPSISYRIENETHIHHPSENITFSEVWLDRILARKLKMKAFADMSTPFDTSRIQAIVKE